MTIPEIQNILAKMQSPEESLRGNQKSLNYVLHVSLIILQNQHKCQCTDTKNSYFRLKK